MNFQVELTSYCDLTCCECPNVDMKRQRQFMSKDVFNTILYKYIVPYRTANLNEGHRPTFIPHKDGEPLLNKNLQQMLEQVSEAVPDMNIDIYTHGRLLPAWAKRKQDFIDFIGTLPNRFRMLISFHFHNHDGTVNDYTEATAYIRNAFYRKPPNLEIILVSHLVSPMTQAGLLEWRAGWMPEIQRGLAVHANASINPWTGRIDDANVSHFNGCPYADFGHWFFGVTGNLIACCMDLEEEIVFGNVMTDDPAAMFAKVQAFYQKQTRREVEYPVCHNCFGMPPAAKLVQIGGVG